ncbi:Sec-independent protein translocase protein TatC [Microbacterium foliorum]|uniref:Sec-independent protein translocase protein TatC n=2 Tax=Microbacteriaceae TaxID=85023 RepID=A0A0F0KBF4_9MICO|nr:Sec-independent protein translocase protein TatCy [Microbacterium foliorum]MCP1429889.1 sec-independent protein translocase protein TatC [Microbacterium foliorum]CAH0156676.1 Sec-independent protein translocase protein TatC [Microbacterium foliorum]CAH0235843.1 Sec-independent protein translocase protein TatC [Microbacterium foliorum]
MSALDSADQEAPGRDRRMSLGAHLVELRKRLFIAAGALVVGMIVAFIVTEPIIELLSVPIRTIAAEAGREYTGLNFTTVTSGFDLRMRIAFAIGLLISAPVWLWQVWAFVMPGLTKKETQYTWGFLGAAVPLFFGGCTVAFFVLPHVIEIMAGFVPKGMAQFFDYAIYYDFVFKFLLVLGIAFVLPVFLVALNLAGIVSGRDILKGWRVAILVCTVFAAVTTPPADVFSMLLLMGSMIVLYFAATLISMLFDRRKRKRDEAAGITPVTA